jgi:multiple sugar transport system permease protein
LIVALFPFYWMLISSILPQSSLYQVPPSIVPTDISLESFRIVLFAESFPFFRYLINSTLVGLVAATLATTISIFGAYSFSRLNYYGRGFLARGVLVSYMFAGILFVVPIFQIVAGIGLIDSRMGLLGVHFIFMIPLALYLLGNYFRSIPHEIEEAAMIDGYSRLEVIFYITIPISMPAIVAVFMYAFLLSWNEYLYASIIIRSTELFTLPIGIENLQNSFNQVWGQVMAASLLTTLPVLILYLYLEKYMMAGLSFGSMD